MRFDVLFKGIGIFIAGFIISILLGGMLSNSSTTTAAPFIAMTWIAVIYLASIVTICTMLILDKLNKK